MYVDQPYGDVKTTLFSRIDRLPIAMEAQPWALIGSFSNDDDDGKEDVKKAVGLLEIRVSQNLAKLGEGSP